jgi:hypothetical protein
MKPSGDARFFCCKHFSDDFHDFLPKFLFNFDQKIPIIEKTSATTFDKYRKGWRKVYRARGLVVQNYFRNEE